MSRRIQGWGTTRTDLAGLVGIYGFAISAGFSTAAVNVFLALILVATTLAWKPFWDECKRLSIVWSIGALAAYVIIHSLVSNLMHPILGESTNPHWIHILLITGAFSLPIGWWLSRYPSHLPRILGLVALGLVIGLIRELDLERIWVGGFSDRHAWGKPLGQVSYLAAVGFSSSVVFTLRAWQGRDSVGRRLALTACFLLLGGFFFLVLLGTQTRGAWFAAAFVVGIYLIFEWWQAIRCSRRALSIAAATTALFVMITAFLYLENSTWERRLKNVSQITSAILDLDAKTLMRVDRSLGSRVGMWREGVGAVAQKPLFGWGIGSKPLVTQKTSSKRERKGHFHNLYVEIAVDLGLVGLLLFITVYATLARTLIARLRQGPRDTVVLLAATAFSVSLLAVLSDIIVGQTAARAVWLIIVALLVMFALQTKDSAGRRHAEFGVGGLAASN